MVMIVYADKRVTVDEICILNCVDKRPDVERAVPSSDIVAEVAEEDAPQHGQLNPAVPVLSRGIKAMTGSTVNENTTTSSANAMLVA